MKKITLMDIMESLNSENVDDASNALHEWFVEQAMVVNKNINGIVDEAESLSFVVTATEFSAEGDDDYSAEDFKKAFSASSAEEAQTMALEEISNVHVGEDLVSEFGWTYGGSGYRENDGGEGIFITNVTQGDLDEARVDELSTDTMRSYANKARKVRDKSVDDEVVGRRVAGLNMVADKTRRERAKPQYEDRVDELSTDTLRSYANKARKVRDKSVDDEVVGRRVAGLDMVANKARKEKAKPQYEAEESAFRVTADFIFEEMDEFHFESASKVFHASSAEEAHAMAQEEIDDFGGDPKFTLSELVYSNGWDEGASGYMDGPERIEIIKVEPETTVESAVLDSHDTYYNESISEADLIAELNEAFKGLETVTDKLQNQEGAQVGEAGKVPVNKKGTLPNKKGADRVGGKAVEIKNDQHKGYEREKAPVAKDVKVDASGSKADQKEVKGNNSALLNKVDNKIQTTSPISGKGAKGLKK